MDPKPAKYGPNSEDDVIDLVTRFPFAWIVSSEAAFNATPLPIRPHVADGRLVALIGHFGRHNPQVERLRAHPRAHLLFTGAHGYISPSWLSDRTQAPTWNYASVTFACDIHLIEDASGIEALLRDLIDTQEAGREQAWSLDDMGERAARLARGVIGFRADIVDSQASFKLGQDEADREYREILTALDRDSATDLAEAMRRQNPHR
ncbi:FMN-binding negative transcriptional regulator [Asticcacaulis sp. 201]|uniref:FMN-binding negative transcriptional regulator n=1 Tax=Asticcacaulis sp. 201 TaxID=3028787 RepID=UPI0029169BD0|nr:FMN-binding negative transcriptional regulator [Asticcacaulis sp. 201]MDV6330732.1 FMN-binding negative transcriptional regulator [Asticcacaulis sp. 201]